MQTTQEVFDYVVAHLYKQGKPAIEIRDEDTVVCRYRAPDGCACAVGCIIPDGEYDPGFEGASARGLLYHVSATNDKSFTEILSKHINILQALQCVHDGAPKDPDGLTLKGKFRKEYLKKRLSTLAEQFSLEFKVPQG